MQIRTLLVASNALFITSISFSVAAYQEKSNEQSESYWEFLLLGGTAALDQHSTTFTLFDGLHADKLTQHNKDSFKAWTVQTGLGYAIPLFNSERYSDAVQWFPIMQPQINTYFLKGNMNGLSDQFFEFPGEGGDSDYKIALESTRLMFDTALTIISWKNISFYGIAGIGPSWNRVGLHIKETPPDCLQEVNLSKHTDTNFAYEFGGGFNYNLFEHLSLTAEYLYTGIQNVELASSGDLMGADISDVESDSFDIHSQALLLGFRFAF